MFKALIKRLFLALFKQELESLEADFQGRIENLRQEVTHDLMNDYSFFYEVTEHLIYDGEVTSVIEDNLRESLESLEMRIDELEQELNK